MPGAGRGGATGSAGASAGAEDGGTGGVTDPSGGLGGSGASDPTGGSAGIDGGTGGGPASGVCENPMSHSENLEFCEGGFVHRPTAAACSLPTRDSQISDLPASAGSETAQACRRPETNTTCVGINECTRDADCGPNAYCLRDEYEDELENNVIVHYCFAPCETDADCADDELCGCGSAIQNATREPIPLGECRKATCRVDADCGASTLCISPLYRVANFVWGDVGGTFYCQTPNDECHGPSTCPQPADDLCCPESSCDYWDGRFVCGIRELCEC